MTLCVILLDQNLYYFYIQVISLRFNATSTSLMVARKSLLHFSSTNCLFGQLPHRLSTVAD